MMATVSAKSLDPRALISLRPNRWKGRSPSEYRTSLDEIGRKLGVKEWHDWYGVSKADFREAGGSGLLLYFRQSHIHAIISVYGEHPWLPWKFERTSRGIWDSEVTRKSFMSSLGKDLGYKHWEDWYQVQREDFEDHGGDGLLRKHGNSVVKTVVTVLNEFPWKVERFAASTIGYWSDINKQREFFDALEKKLNITHWEMWYQISTNMVIDNGARPILKHYDWSLSRCLQAVYPQHPWIPRERYWWSKSHDRERGSKSQSHLFQAVVDTFHKDDVHMNVKFRDFIGKEKDISVTRENSLSWELDVGVPSVPLAFEYQGQQHYTDHSLYGAAPEQSKKDQRKRDACKQHGVTLIEVPYWWNGHNSSLVATILEVRPDLKDRMKIPNSELIPIQREPPEKLLKMQDRASKHSAP
eukprot:TRINITY_DN8392_c0_g1_i3.p1 TRINITY_DN8392_c0_g1~~TRINITY_DN8392_c0_g1_i3.p1  ORF type:complete len:412 (-),score=53.45 TRINITY_DN8392_c0_g1_i3:248-1483(-)